MNKKYLRNKSHRDPSMRFVKCYRKISNKFSRKKIVHSMCLTWRHDYGFLKNRENQISGMNIKERNNLFRRMLQVFDNNIVPIFYKN